MLDHFSCFDHLLISLELVAQNIVFIILYTPAWGCYTRTLALSFVPLLSLLGHVIITEVSVIPFGYQLVAWHIRHRNDRGCNILRAFSRFWAARRRVIGTLLGLLLHLKWLLPLLLFAMIFEFLILVYALLSILCFLLEAIRIAG